MRSTSIFSILIFLIFCQCDNKQQSTKDVENKAVKKSEISTKEDKNKTKSILCFGNSLTAGFGLDENQAWPSLLQSRLDSLGLGYAVVNAGISGETTSNGLSRLDWALNQQVDVFILELGANDMLRGLNVSQTRENLDKIITTVKKTHPKVKIVLAGMLAAPNMGQEYVAEFDKIFPTLAKKHETSLIPFFLQNVAGVSTLNLPDGKHPNATGQRIVLENVWKVVKPLL